MGSKDKCIYIYEVLNGMLVSRLPGHRSSVCCMMGHREFLASGGDIGCNSLILWDIKTWTIKSKVQSHSAAISSIVNLQDDQHLITGSYDKKICVYSYREGGLKYTLPSNKSSVTSIVMNVDGSKMISCGLDHIINIWQVVKRDNVLFFL